MSLRERIEEFRRFCQRRAHYHTKKLDNRAVGFGAQAVHSAVAAELKDVLNTLKKLLPPRLEEPAVPEVGLTRKQALLAQHACEHFFQALMGSVLVMDDDGRHEVACQIEDQATRCNELANLFFEAAGGRLLVRREK